MWHLLEATKPAGSVLTSTARQRTRAASSRWTCVLLAVGALGASIPATAAAYTYDYTLGGLADDAWGTRAVAHNYHYLRGTTGTPWYICVKLTRTSDGSNYGDV